MDAKNVAIVITDGVPFPDERYQPAIDEAEKLRMQRSKKHIRSLELFGVKWNSKEPGVILLWSEDKDQIVFRCWIVCNWNNKPNK